LTTVYSLQDTVDVRTENNVRVGEDAESGYVLHQFKNYVGNVKQCTVEWKGRSNYAPKLSPVYLQIYNYYLSEWVITDGNNTSSERTNFTLSTKIANLTDYKDSSKMITCRVYQLA